MTSEVAVHYDGGCGSSFPQTGKAHDWAPIGWLVISVLRAMNGQTLWTPMGTIAKGNDVRRLRFFCSTKCIAAWSGDDDTRGLTWVDGRPPQFVPGEPQPGGEALLHGRVGRTVWDKG